MFKHISKERSDEEKKEIYDKWHKLINMSEKELKAWGEDPDHLEASLNREEAKENGKIQSGYDSFHRIKRRKDKPFEEWSAQDFDNASQENGFNGRMLGGKPGEPVKDTGMSKWEISLRNWGHDPSKTNSPAYSKWKKWNEQQKKKKTAKLIAKVFKLSFLFKNTASLKTACVNCLNDLNDKQAKQNLKREMLKLSSKNHVFSETIRTNKFAMRKATTIEEIKTTLNKDIAISDKTIEGTYSGKNVVNTFKVGEYEVNLLIDDTNNVFMNCNCGFWQYQGPEYHAKQEGYLLGEPKGTATKPTIKDPNKDNKLCKHTLAVLERIKTNVK